MSKLKLNMEAVSDKSKNPVTRTEYIQHNEQWLDNVVGISPEAYGAKGNGTTDDTAAINRCLSENPNSTIVFKKGTYIISDTLHAYGNTGGQTIIVGGATIKWNGGASDKAMFDCNKSGGRDSRCLIIGGEFDGADKVAYGVVLNSFHAMIDGTKIVDCTNTNLVVGEIEPVAGELRSLQAQINNVMIFNTSNASSWSNSNRRGILVTEPDNFFSNVDTNRFNKGVEVRVCGHEFANCHFTCQYKSPLAQPYNAYAVYINRESETATDVIDFVNCYFDNYKYCFGAAKANRVHINCSNSHYFYSGKQTTDTKVYTFLTDKYVPYVSVKNMAINVDGTCLFQDSYMTGAANYFEKQYVVQEFVKDTNRVDNEAYETVQAKNCFKPGEFAQIIILNPTVSEGDVFEVGAFVSSTTDFTFIPPIDITFINRSFAYCNWKIRHSALENKWILLEQNAYQPSTFGSFYISNEPEVVNRNGVDRYVYKIYFKSNFTGGLGYGSIRVVAAPALGVYFNHNHMLPSTADVSNENCTELTTEAVDVDSNMKFLFDGDSLTFNYVYGIARLVSRNLGISEFECIAVPGASIPKVNEEADNNIYTRAQSVNFADYDAFVFGAGTNDWNAGIPLGTSYDDTDIYTVYGALNAILAKAYSENPKLRVFFWSPMKRYRTNGGQLIDPAKFTVKNITVKDYSKGIENYFIYKGIPVFNAYEKGVINEFNHEDTDICFDNVHLGEEGTRMFSRKLANWIRANMY